MDLFKTRLAAMDLKSMSYLELSAMYQCVWTMEREAFRELDDDEEVTGKIEDLNTILKAIRTAMYAKIDAQFFKIEVVELACDCGYVCHRQPKDKGFCKNLPKPNQ